MSPSTFFSELNRRPLLSALAAFPAFPGALIPISASARTVTTGSPLPSWNDGAAKQAILNFVAAVSRAGSPDFVPPAERIATLDNDGALRVEQPGSTQPTFALDRVRALAPLHPEWKDMQPFKAVLENDMETLAKTGEQRLAELVPGEMDRNSLRLGMSGGATAFAGNAGASGPEISGQQFRCSNGGELKTPSTSHSTHCAHRNAPAARRQASAERPRLLQEGRADFQDRRPLNIRYC